jgi:hypothetical protein
MRDKYGMGAHFKYVMVPDIYFILSFQIVGWGEQFEYRKSASTGRKQIPGGTV